MGPFLRAAMRATAVCATVAAVHGVHELHHEVKKAEKKAKKAQKHAMEAQMYNAQIHSGSSHNGSGQINVNGMPIQPVSIKPVMFHVNIVSTRVPVIQPGYPNTGAISAYYDQSLGGWRAAPRGTRPSSCDNRGAPHAFVTLPHYVAFAFTDNNGQTNMLFSDKSCSMCGEHCLLTAQQIPYQQIIAISQPQIFTEAGFQSSPSSPMASTPQPVMQPPLPGQPQPLSSLPPSNQYPPGMAPPQMTEDSRDANPIYGDQPHPLPPPM